MNKVSRNYIQRLWDELAEYDIAAHQAALDHLLEGLCFLLGAQNAVWVAVVRMPDAHPQDPIKGWRPHTTYHLRPNPAYERRAAKIVEEIAEHQVDICTIRQAAGAGIWRTNRLCDLADKAWFVSDFYHSSYTAAGVADAMWSSCPVSEDAEVYFGLHRYTGQPSFTQEERELLAGVLRGLKWFHRRQMLSHGLLIASTSLTDTERRVLEGLLGGELEKDVAELMGQSYHTTHQHVKSIYRKFGVNNRAKLTALWLGRGG